MFRDCEQSSIRRKSRFSRCLWGSSVFRLALNQRNHAVEFQSTSKQAGSIWCRAAARRQAAIPIRKAARRPATSLHSTALSAKTNTLVLVFGWSDNAALPQPKEG